MDVSYLFSITTALVVIGLMIKSVEFIYSRDEFDQRNTFDWDIVGKDFLQNSKAGKLFAKIYSKRGMHFMSILNLGIGFIILFQIFRGEHPLFFLPIFVVLNLLLIFRHSFGLDGADQMSIIILLTILLCNTFVRHPEIQRLGLYFIGAQLIVSYAAAGIAKLYSREWRSGIAITGILNTYTYGSCFTRSVICQSKPASVAICWATILFESLFPLAIFLPTEWMLGVIALGVLFHLSIAVVMGLNDFLWAFGAAYPGFYLIGVTF